MVWLLHSALHFLSSIGLKAFTGPLKDVSGAVKDLKDIRSRQLPAEPAPQKQILIHEVSDAQVRFYDPNRRQIEDQVRKNLALILAIALLGSIALARLRLSGADASGVTEAVVLCLALLASVPLYLWVVDHSK